MTPHVPKIGLQILLQGGGYLSIILPKMEAETILLGWREGKLAPVIGGQSLPLVPGQQVVLWAARVDFITGMHTFPPEMLLQQQQQPQGGAWMSGFQQR